MMKKTSCRALVMFVFLVGLPMQVFAHQTSINLFDATPVVATGPVTSPAEAVPFASTSLVLDFAPGDRAVISSTPDGTGPIVIDNFITINGENACKGAEGQLGEESCFGSFIRDPADPEVVGMSITAVLAPIPAINVRKFIPVGTNTVVFDLRDFGAIAGNTELFLVTTATVTTPQPATASNAFDAGMDLVTGQLSPAVVAAFQAAFKEQVGKPILKQLEDAHADPGTIARINQQLKQAGIELANEAATALASQVNGQTLLSELQRNLDTVFSEPAVVPTSINKFSANVGAPTIQTNQSVGDILANGFDPGRVEYNWRDISAKTVFGQGPLPGPVFAPNLALTAEMATKLGLDGTKSVTASAGVAVEGKTATITVKVEGTVSTKGPAAGGAAVSVMAKITMK